MEVGQGSIYWVMDMDSSSMQSHSLTLQKQKRELHMSPDFGLVITPVVLGVGTQLGNGGMAMWVFMFLIFLVGGREERKGKNYGVWLVGLDENFEYLMIKMKGEEISKPLFDI